MPALIQVNDLQYVVDWRGSVRNVPILFVLPQNEGRSLPTPTIRKQQAGKRKAERNLESRTTFAHGPHTVGSMEERYDEPTLFDMPTMQTHKPTVDELEHSRATREQLAQWGVPWPPEHGWRRKLLHEARKREKAIS